MLGKVIQRAKVAIEGVEPLVYKLTCKTQFARDILGKASPLPKENFSLSHRLDYGSHTNKCVT